MFNRNRNRYNMREEGFFASMPLFFKVWFAFVLSIVLTIFGVVGYTFYSVATNPNATAHAVGQLVGEATKGYNEAANQ